jgi:DUF2993 family protein
VSSRAIRITAAVVVFLLVAGFVVDRLAVRFVAKQIAVQAQRSQGLTTRPKVSIGGALFLPQVVGGKYDNIDIDVRGASANGLRVDDLHAHATGVHLPLSRILSRDVQKIPVDALNADVELTYTDLNQYLAAQTALANSQQNGAQATAPKVTDEGGALKVDSTVSIFGTTYPVEVVAVMGVEANAITFTPRDFSEGVAALLPPEWRGPVLKLLTFRVPIEGLPFNLKLTAARVLSDRMRFTAAGQDVILDTTQLQTPTPVPAG